MRYLDAHALADQVLDADAVVVGTGVAGLTAALGLSPRRVAVLTKSELGVGGSSPWAQGGVAAALGGDDSPRLHALDTLAAGAGLSEAGSVAILTEEGPERVRRLIELGARFDRGPAGQLSLGREGAHRRRRVLHANGDATGAEMVRALVAEVRRQPLVEVWEHAFALDLVRSDERVVGVLARHGSRTVFHRAGSVVLATGGFGQLYARTTNPVHNTGDGLAMAARAGARLVDLEYVQFHPTALDVDADPLPLVTEALRGEGALLVDDAGERFMVGQHPAAELAPRDVVARAIWGLQADGGRAWLDCREAVGDAFPERFPTVWSHCRRHGVDPRRQAIPVTPAAHYTMAGVEVDACGRASLDGLWACGEVSASGVHGANRLASNSLLEALVFGDRVARDIAGRGPADLRHLRPRVHREDRLAAGEDVAHRVRQLMWRRAGLVRDGQGLESALGELGRLAAAGSPDLAPGEVANLATCGRLVAAAALVRQESRGSHFRTDFPDPDLAWQRRLYWTYRPDRPEALPLEPVLRSEPAAVEIA